MELVTKSGTNQWHGSAFEYLRNTITEANTFFNDFDNIPKPKLIQNSFGANLGGPIVKDKLFSSLTTEAGATTAKTRCWRLFRWTGFAQRRRELYQQRSGLHQHQPDQHPAKLYHDAYHRADSGAEP